MSFIKKLMLQEIREIIKTYKKFSPLERYFRMLYDPEYAIKISKNWNETRISFDEFIEICNFLYYNYLFKEGIIYRLGITNFDLKNKLLGFYLEFKSMGDYYGVFEKVIYSYITSLNTCFKKDIILKLGRGITEICSIYDINIMKVRIGIIREKKRVTTYVKVKTIFSENPNAKIYKIATEIIKKAINARLRSA